MSQFDYGRGGGGFMNSPSSPGFGGGSKDKDSSIRPLTIAQLLRADHPHNDAPWTVDNSQFTQFTLVAQVMKVATQMLNTVYTLDDGTGRMDGRKWTDQRNSGPSPDDWAEIQEHRYARVFGLLKVHNGARHIFVLHIRPIANSHEIFYHILDTIAVSVFLEKGGPNNSGDPNAMTGVTNGGDSNNNWAQLPELHRKILHFLRANEDNGGVYIMDIARGVASTGVSAQQVGQAIEELLEESHIYSAEDQHFHTT